MPMSYSLEEGQKVNLTPFLDIFLDKHRWSGSEPDPVLGIFPMSMKQSAYYGVYQRQHG